jgi:hypothetical protein
MGTLVLFLFLSLFSPSWQWVVAPMAVGGETGGVQRLGTVGSAAGGSGSVASGGEGLH